MREGTFFFFLSSSIDVDEVNVICRVTRKGYSVQKKNSFDIYSCESPGKNVLLFRQSKGKKTKFSKSEEFFGVHRREGLASLNNDDSTGDLSLFFNSLGDRFGTLM